MCTSGSRLTFQPLQARLYITLTALALTALALLSTARAGDEATIEAAKRIDKVAKEVEQYGVVSVSPPILVAADGNGGQSPFAFDLTHTSDQYYDDARRDVQAKVAISRQRSMSLEVQGRFGQDETQSDAFRQQKARAEEQAANAREARSQALAAAKTEYDAQIALAAKESDPDKSSAAYTTATDRYVKALKDASPAPSADPLTSNSVGTGPSATSAIASGNIPTAGPAIDGAPLFSLLDQLSDADPVINNRAAIITAAGDNTIEGIFRLLGDPSRAAEFSGRKAFFGVTMISVTPGHRTRRKYAADVSVLSELQAREVPFAEIPGIEGLNGLPTDVLTRIGCDSGAAQCAGGTMATAIVARWTGKTDADVLSSLSPTGVSRQSSNRDRITQSPIDEAWHEIPRPLKGGLITLASPGPDGSFAGGLGALRCTADSNGYELRCTYEADYAPTVAAVSPMTEAQVLDMGSSDRNRLRLAMDLAAAITKAGENQSARVMAEYVRQLQKDAVSRTPQNLVTGYSNGSLFGYQIGPAFMAIEDPSARKAESGDVLQRQSFPALLVFGVRNEVAQPLVFRIHMTRSDGTVAPADKLIVLRPYISLQQTWHWNPLRRLFADMFRISESERAGWISTLYDAQRKLGSGETANFVRMRIRALLTSVGATESLIPLPSRPALRPLEIQSIAPTEWRLEADKTGAPKVSRARFVIQGRGFGKETVQCQARSIGSTVVAPQAAELVGDQIAICTFMLPVDSIGPLIVSLLDEGRKAVAYATPVSVLAPPKGLEAGGSKQAR